ncbi:unnamed protein product [Moneuplotes crassus]|uniref:Phosphatidylinositol-glycan biosynthesis class W protein n=1 Tax=Euplotes crassus TaxID=5936 RepID=A0AAD1UDD2_EUPCR|nr:unnamed protein product [Moneuplotes crassus]
MELPNEVYERSPYKTDTPFADLQMGSDEYKHIREKFVSGFDGGSYFEIAAVTVMPLLLCAVNMMMVAYLKSISSWWKKIRGEDNSVVRPKDLSFLAHVFNIFFDVGTICVPFIFSVYYPASLYSIYIGITGLVVLLKILGGDLYTLPFTSEIKEYIVIKPKEGFKGKKPNEKRFSMMIRIFKTGVMIPTVICIFAVDFHDFPRRFVKTHTFGISLMDIGTGCLIFISGISANVIRNKGVPLASRLVKSIKAIPIIMAIALGGYFSRYFTNHPEVVTEYGVHWNFFWTLAIISIASACVSNPRSRSANSFGMYTIYQLFLYFGGTEYIFNAPRDNFFNKNREGILGCIGYICIYLLGIACGEFVIKKSEAAKESWKNPPCTQTLVNLLPVYILSCLGTFICLTYVQSYSRRSVNITYGVAVISFISLSMIVTYTVITMLKGYQYCYLMSIIEENQFVFFMISNLVMSLYNISFMTTFHSNAIAIPVLVVYITLTLLLTDLCTRIGIKLK